MSDLIRVGALGLTHDHVWDGLKALSESGMGELVAASDPRPDLLQKVSAFGAERLFTDHAQLLECDDLDAVYVHSDNRESAELAVEAARRGLHVMVKKPMAAELEGAVEMQKAAEDSGVLLMIKLAFCLAAGTAARTSHGSRGPNRTDFPDQLSSSAWRSA